VRRRGRRRRDDHKGPRFVAVAGRRSSSSATATDLLFSSNIGRGGDNAGHIVTAVFLIHDLLPQGASLGGILMVSEGFRVRLLLFPCLPVVAALSSCSPMRLPSSSSLSSAGSLSRRRLGLRAVGGLQEPVPGLMAAATFAVLVQYLPTHLWREHSLDARRRVLVLSRVLSGLLFLGGVRVRAPDRPAALAGRRALYG